MRDLRSGWRARAQVAFVSAAASRRRVTCTSSHSVHAVRYFHSLDEREASSPGGCATRCEKAASWLRGTQISGYSACLDLATFISRRNEGTESTAHLEL